MKFYDTLAYIIISIAIMLTIAYILRLFRSLFSKEKENSFCECCDYKNTCKKTKTVSIKK